MNYEQGLAALRKLSNGSTWFPDVLLYEARLLENLQQERLYGSSEQFRATRAQIIDQLNRLVYDHFGISFNDLCQRLPPEIRTTSASPSGLTRDSEQTVQMKDATDAIYPFSPTNVFIGYSHKDKRFLNELRAHLAQYIRSGTMDAWDDTNILPGAKWYEEIKIAIQSARVAVFLISADFLASDFIARKEVIPLLRLAEQRGIKILCVIVRSCAFDDTELAQFQTINAPSNSLSNMTQGKRDEVWTRVAKLVKDILQDK